jgi:hypothetical protein
MYDHAPTNSIILTGTVKAPWKYRDYETHKHKALSESVDWDEGASIDDDVRRIEAILRDPKYDGGFLFITRSQIANDELFGLLPYGLDQLEAAIKASGEFKLYFENKDARIYVLKDYRIQPP